MPAETTRAYLHALRDYVNAHGRPVALYSDRHSLFTKHDPEDPTPTQFERAARQLALSPQAKGRVERAFQTLQDPLVKARRLANVRTLEAANAAPPTFVEDYNARFSTVPASPLDAHRRLARSHQELLWVTSEQSPRTLSKSLSCQYRARQYLIQTNAQPAYALRGARITVCDDGNEASIARLREGKPLPFKVFRRHDLPECSADDKTVNDKVDQARRRQARANAKPSANPPWRRSFSTRAAPAAHPNARP